MADDRLFRATMGRPAPGAEAHPVEIGKLAGQFAGTLLLRLAAGVIGERHMDFSVAVTQALRVDRAKRPRDVLRKELRRFLDGSVQTQDVGIPVWLNLVSMTDDGAERAIDYAARFGIETIEAGRAILVGLDAERTETLCHIAGATHVDAFRLVCNGVQIEHDAGRIRLDVDTTEGPTP